MAKNIIQKITDKAERLHELRNAISVEEESLKEKLEPLKKERDELQDYLVEELKKNNLSGIKISSGENYTRAVRKGVEITNEVFALKWAKENNAFSINRVIAAQKLKDVEKMPVGFARVETEYISVRKPKADKEDKENGE